MNGGDITWNGEETFLKDDTSKFESFVILITTILKKGQKVT